MGRRLTTTLIRHFEMAVRRHENAGSLPTSVRDNINLVYERSKKELLLRIEELEQQVSRSLGGRSTGESMDAEERESWENHNRMGGGY